MCFIVLESEVFVPTYYTNRYQNEGNGLMHRGSDRPPTPNGEGWYATAFQLPRGAVPVSIQIDGRDANPAAQVTLEVYVLSREHDTKLIASITPADGWNGTVSTGQIDLAGVDLRDQRLRYEVYLKFSRGSPATVIRVRNVKIAYSS